MSDEESNVETPTLTSLATDSILNTVKQALGVGTDYDPFDPELIMYINGVFSTLHQLGVGPVEPYSIESSENKWSEFMESNKAIQSVKTYVYSKVRLIFDPPTTSFGIKSFEDICKELEWRLRAQAEEVGRG